MVLGQSIGSGRRLSADERQAYEEQGFLIRRQVFSQDEIACLASEADALLERTDLIDKLNLRCRFQSQCAAGECLFETFDPVIDIAPHCGKIALHARIFEILEDLYGEEACLFKDKLIFKPPGAMGCGLHQDFISWPGFPRSFVTVLVPIDAATQENGCTEVFPGHHRQGCLSPEDGDYHELAANLVDENRGIKLTLEPGAIAIFGAFIPHRAAPNQSNGWRRQLYLSYNAASDGGRQRTAHYREFHGFLRRKYAEYGLVDTYFL
ncbi:MAG TPA: phytanoyl-CoA dioxygenase family protein [Planctomycetaceae bacterium]|nr:phytanoyl-CoA dioxygenase family protein [Planctomycetaceae bacterium]